MISVFNRKELLITFDMKRQANVCKKLSAKGIDYAVKTTNLQSSAPAGVQRARTGNYGIDQKYSYEYKIYVRKGDYDRASSLIR